MRNGYYNLSWYTFPIIVKVGAEKVRSSNFMYLNSAELLYPMHGPACSPRSILSLPRVILHWSLIFKLRDMGTPYTEFDKTNGVVARL